MTPDRDPAPAEPSPALPSGVLEHARSTCAAIVESHRSLGRRIEREHASFARDSAEAGRRLAADARAGHNGDAARALQEVLDLGLSTLPEILDSRDTTPVAQAARRDWQAAVAVWTAAPEAPEDTDPPPCATGAGR